MITQGKYTLDADFNPVPCHDLPEWARWFETAYRTLAQDRDERPGVPDVRVSTIFLGIDMSLLGLGPPILWETMVFGGELDGYAQRYMTKEGALAGHYVLCREVFATKERP